MATNVLTNLNLNQNQLLNPVIHVASTAPGSPVAGQLWFNTSAGGFTANTLYYWSGSAWIEADAQALSFGSVTAQTSFGASSANGSATTASHSDHTHGTPAIPALSALNAPAANIPMGGYTFTGLPDPATASSAATKNYVDATAQGLSWKDPIQAASTAALGSMYSTPFATYTYNSLGGVGDTITAGANGVVNTMDSQGLWTALSTTVTACTAVSTTVTFTVASGNANMAVGESVNISGVTGFTTNNPNGDWTVATLVATTGFTVVVGAAPTGTYSSGGTVSANAARVLIKNETSTNAPYNGIYTVTTLGTAGGKAVFTRATDMDTNVAPDTGISKYDYATMFVELGTINEATQWQCTNTGGVTPGTTAVSFAQIGAATSYSAGTGLTLTGNSFSVNASQTQVTALGTVVTGTWNGTNVAVAYGGTGGTTGAQTAAGARSNLSAVGTYSATITTSAGSAYSVAHGLNTYAVQVSVWSAATGGSLVWCDVANVDANHITVTTAAAQTNIFVVVHG